MKRNTPPGTTGATGAVNPRRQTASGGHDSAAGGASSGSGGSDHQTVDASGGSDGKDDGPGGAESGTGGVDNEPERACLDDDTEAQACGLNNRGQRERYCTDGVWGAWGPCVDPDHCEDSTLRQIGCEQAGPKTLQPQECREGVWRSTGGCILPCAEGLAYDALLDVCMEDMGCEPGAVPFGGGTGTPEDPYTVCSIAHLRALTSSPDSHFALAQSLDLADVIPFTPLCTAAAPFAGTLDGRGRILARLVIQQETSDDVGLFSWIDGGEVVDLTLRDVEIRGKNFVGALAGHATNATHVEGVFVERGAVDGSHDVGGLLGYLEQSTVSDSSAAVTVFGSLEMTNDYRGVGGLVGHSEASTVASSSAEGTVTGYEAVGGLVGRSYDSALSGSHAIGAVLGNYYVGGLVGHLGKSTLSDSYATGTVTGLGGRGAGHVGGLAGGVFMATVSDSFATGDVRDGVSAGGLVGFVAAGSTVLRSSATGSVTGPYLLGGLVGQFISSTVSNSSATGNVTATDEVDFDRQWIGGLVGYSGYGTLLDSFATGAVSGYEGVGGLVGQADDTTLVSRCNALGQVSGSLCVGGLVGLVSDSDVRQSYATGNVFGQDSVGGLLGAIGSIDVTQSYALGNVSGERSVGGLVGSTYDVSISQSYALGNVAGNLEVGALVGYAYVYTLVPVQRSFAREQGSIPLVGHMETEGSLTEPSVDSALLPAAIFGDQALFTQVGWDFENVWTMSSAQGRPLLFWQVATESP